MRTTKAEIGAMIIKYQPRFDIFPELARVRPFVSPAMRERARQSPPPALPSHCTPWVDANSHGLLLTYPYQATLTVHGRDSEPPQCSLSPRSAQLVYGNFVQLFARGHFGLASGYSFRTDPGIGIYTNHLPYGQPSKVRVVPGLVECWRYPKGLFIVIEAPPPGETITLEYGDPLCVLMPMACERVEAVRMTDAEWQAYGEQRWQWDTHLNEHPELRWTSAEGIEFTHMYKVFEREHGRPTATEKRLDSGMTNSGLEQPGVDNDALTSTS
jgi:hypothetical protein